MAMVWSDIETDTPEVFAHPDEDELDERVDWYIEGLWKEFEPDVPQPDYALTIMGGRMEYSFLDLPGFGILSHETLSAVQGLLIDYEDDLELDLDNAIDEEPAKLRREIKRARQIRKQVEEAIK